MTERPASDFIPELHDEGSGPVVVFIHGSASDARTWHQQVDAFTDEFRVITYSRRYHWPNEPAPDGTEYSMTEHVDDLVNIIESIGDGPVDLVGHSYGGFIALIASIRHPQLVRSQVLMEPPVVPLFISDPPKPAELVRVLVKKPALGAALLKFGATGLVPATKAAEKGDMDRAIRISGKAILGKDAFDQLSDQRWEQVMANNIRAEYLSDIFDPLTDAEVRSIDVPTMLVSAENSPRLWPLLVDHLAELLPNAEHVVVPNASHILHEDNAESFNQKVIQFLRSPRT